ncbi:MAG: hypothetical protein M5R37_11570 [Melioribacteraceae bacterium]|nr:hypothetical protein [Melioribacteraceae bacterium]
MNNQFVKSLLCLIIFSIPSISAQIESEFFSLENRLKFANYLFYSGDYIRAIDEFNEVDSTKSNDSLQFKIGLSLQQLNRLEEATVTFRDLMRSRSLTDEASFEYARTIYLWGHISRHFSITRREPLRSSIYRKDVEKLIQLDKLQSAENQIDSASFFEPFDKKESIELLKFYQRKLNFDDKNPTLAAVMSTVLPGLGKIYTGNYGDGITALLLTGILTFLSVDNFDAGHDFRGWLFAGLAAYFYAGNIYGSAVSVNVYNANLRISFDSDLRIFLNEKNHFVPKSKWLVN